MRDVMADRGPDEAGTWISPDARIGLGHRRLSVIDLSDHANQPMCNEDGTLWITFNGEIYNHAAIRAELDELRPIHWKTAHSDTEVILHAFQQWGIDCLHKFEGMFGFGLWDTRRRELWLVRDRLGIKPLYYSLGNGRISFASNIKALLIEPDQRRAVNLQALYHYLSFSSTPAPNTLFDGIKKVPAGTWMRITEDGQVREHQYWNVLDHVDPLVGVSEDEIAERLLEEIRASVDRCRVADVEVGSFLSGGIDSSITTALFAEGATRQVKTFTIGVEGNYDSITTPTHVERDFARLMSDKIGTEHHERLLNISDLVGFLPRMIELMDEPIGDPICVPIYYLSKLARDNGLYVCLVGDGADELLFGYPHGKTLLKMQRMNALPLPRSFKALALNSLSLVEKRIPFPYERLRRAVHGEPVFWAGEELFTDGEKMRLLAPHLRSEMAGFTSATAIEPAYRTFVDKAWEKSHYQWMTYAELSIRLPEVLLMRHDKMGMGVSLETRVPFLDHRLVALAMSIPEAVKTKGGTLKYILKKAVRGHVPDRIIDRPKGYMGLPMQEWILGQLGENVQREVDDFCRETELLDGKEVRRTFSEGPTHQVWALMNLALWWKTHIKRVPSDIEAWSLKPGAARQVQGGKLLAQGAARSVSASTG
jgi:asparagine synthase (glutamine-hydrolysing)